ncbi:MAG: hypothetical protein KDC03_20570, partial [Flavobacteriales bacterium]|nr:hypothetical protein [Flavobacteriales bacterium]
TRCVREAAGGYGAISSILQEPAYPAATIRGCEVNVKIAGRHLELEDQVFATTVTPTTLRTVIIA